MPLVLGVNHRTASVALREKLSLAADRLAEALAGLKQRVPLEEAVVLSTCNRFEIYVQAADRTAARTALIDYLSEHFQCPLDPAQFYVHEKEEGVKHLFRVAAGLDSLVPGEHEILGQVKQAYQLAQKSGFTGKLLNVLFQRSLYVGKRVRTETGLSMGSSSVPSVAVTMAGRVFGELAGRHVLVLGAGQMAELTVKHLQSQKVNISVANRTFEHAVELAKSVNGSALTWDEGLRQLAQVDMVIGSVSVPEPILLRRHLEAAFQTRRGKSLFLIDIAVPRCIDPSIQTLDNVYLFNLDDLQRVVDESTTRRAQQIAKAEEMIASETQEFARWLAAHRLGQNTSLKHG